jgi:hypothetical protein
MQELFLIKIFCGFRGKQKGRDIYRGPLFFKPSTNHLSKTLWQKETFCFVI